MLTMLPVLGGEIVERQQCVAILGQALGGLLVFQLVGFEEDVEGGLGGDPGLCHPDLLQRPLGLRLRAHWQLV